MDWFENEEFWRQTYPYMFSPRRLEGTAADLDRVLALTGVSGGRVLDLCCGPGRCAAELARRGFQVTGVDRSTFLLDRARERGRGLEIEWVQEDMRTFRREGAFDLALSMFTSFGYFSDESDDRRVLRNLHDSLRAGGVLLLDTKGKEALARVFQAGDARVEEDGTLFVEQREVLEDWERVRTTWTLVREGGVTRFRFDLRVYSAREMKDRLLEAGFQSVEVHGNLDGDPYGPESHRLVAVARRS